MAIMKTAFRRKPNKERGERRKLHALMALHVQTCLQTDDLVLNAPPFLRSLSHWAWNSLLFGLYIPRALRGGSGLEKELDKIPTVRWTLDQGLRAHFQLIHRARAHAISLTFTDEGRESQRGLGRDTRSQGSDRVEM